MQLQTFLCIYIGIHSDISLVLKYSFNLQKANWPDVFLCVAVSAKATSSTLQVMRRIVAENGAAGLFAGQHRYYDASCDVLRLFHLRRIWLIFHCMQCKTLFESANVMTQGHVCTDAHISVTTRCLHNTHHDQYL